MKYLFFAIFLILGFISANGKDVRILAWDDSVAARSLAWIQGEKETEVSGLHPLRRSKAYPRSSKDVPVVIRALDKPAVDGGKAPEMTCVVNPSFLRPLLILLPDPVAPSGLRGLVIEEDRSSFGWGAMRFVNTSGQDVIVQVEQDATRVPAGWKPVDMNPGGVSRNIGIRIALAEAIETPAYTSVWDHRDDSRVLIFVLRGGDSRLGSLAVKAIPEMKGAEEEISVTKSE